MRGLKAGRLAEAERALRAAILDDDDKFSDAARLQLAALYDRAGRRQEAAAVRVSPRTFYSVTGGYPILSQQDYRAITLEVAARYGVRAVDAGAVLGRHPEWYLDFCHFGRDGHRAVAGLLAAELTSGRWTPLKPEERDPDRAGAHEHLQLAQK